MPHTGQTASCPASYRLDPGITLAHNIATHIPYMCQFGYLLKEKDPKTIKAINAIEIASKDLLNIHAIIFFLNRS
jgi:hypothetical protein